MHYNHIIIIYCKNCYDNSKMRYQPHYGNNSYIPNTIQISCQPDHVSLHTFIITNTTSNAQENIIILILLRGSTLIYKYPQVRFLYILIVILTQYTTLIKTKRNVIVCKKQLYNSVLKFTIGRNSKRRRKRSFRRYFYITVLYFHESRLLRFGVYLR